MSRAVFAKLRDWFVKKSPNHARQTRFSFDGTTITAEGPFARPVSVRLDDIREIGIETTDRGPFVEDVFWLINRDTDALRVPQDSPIFQALMDIFGKWDGFDWGAVTKAMSSAENQYFLCWRRASKSN